MTRPDVVRVVAVADVHCPREGRGALRPLFEAAARAGDVLVVAGDLTSYGVPEEAVVLASELTPLRMPTVAVLGNHDYEAGRAEEVARILLDTGVHVLDGGCCEVAGVGFAGVKGFGGGFGERALQAWGEDAIKQFVHAAVDEAMKLEAALSRLQTAQRVALLHYAPIAATVEGEPPEIYPFLGSSRLEDPIDRFHVAAVFHGHAHAGSLEGRTRGDVPVYNVAAPLLERARPGRPPFRVVEIPLSRPEPDDARAHG